MSEHVSEHVCHCDARIEDSSWRPTTDQPHHPECELGAYILSLKSSVPTRDMAPIDSEVRFKKRSGPQLAPIPTVDQINTFHAEQREREEKLIREAHQRERERKRLVARMAGNIACGILSTELSTGQQDDEAFEAPAIAKRAIGVAEAIMERLGL